MFPPIRSLPAELAFSICFAVYCIGLWVLLD